MLHSLGDAIRTSEAIVIMCGGFGLGLREHCLETMRLSEERLLIGILGMLSHQAHANLPVHAPTDPALVAQASVCYKHPKSRIGFQIESRNKTAVRQFAALYNRSDVSRCGRIHPRLLDTVSNSGFPVYAACEIADWPDHFATVVANKELWRLACRAQAEIIALPQHGWLGKLMAVILPRMSANVFLRTERDMLPLDTQAFNRFHHGGKVHVQDVQALRDCQAEGQHHGQPMVALSALQAKLSEHKAASQAVTP